MENVKKQFGRVSTCLRPKYMTFRFQNLGNGRDDKNRGRMTIFDFDNKKKCPIYFSKIEHFFNFETISSLSTSVFIFYTISQILNRTFHIL